MPSPHSPRSIVLGPSGDAAVTDGNLVVWDGTEGGLVRDGGASGGGGGITQLTGDVTAGPGSGSQVATLANTAVTPATYGTATKVATITIDSKGRITAASETTVTPAESSITFTDITTSDSSTTKHGFLRKLDNNATHYLDGQGGWTTPSGAGTVTHTAGNLTSSQLVVGNASADLKVVSATDGQIPIGKTSDGTVTLGTITAGAGITVTNGAASITLAASGDGFWTTVIAASNSDVSSNTTPATDAELFFSMTANKLYEFEAHIIYQSAVGAGTPDMKFNFNGPATLTGQQTQLLYVGTADSLTGALGQFALTTTGAVGTATTPRMFFVKGWAFSTGGGTGSSGFQFQWSQNTSSVNATTRLAGSLLRWRQLST